MRGLHSSTKSKLIFIATIIIAILSFTWFFLSGLGKADDSKVVLDSWRQMQRVGRYEFSTTVEQIIYPAPKLTNVGRSSTKETYHVTGEADMLNQRMLISLWQNRGSQMSPGDSVDIRLENGEAWGRLTGAEWQHLDNFSADTFAPGNDASAFLRSAKNVRHQEAVDLNLTRIDLTSLRVRAARYSFDLDPDRFAGYMRDQMVKELQRSGKLPMGMNLSLSDQYRRMIASGEVWIGEDGLPLHMTVHMKFPQESSGERLEANVTTDFLNPTRDNWLNARALHWRLIGMLGLPTTPDGIRQLGLPLELGVISLAFMILIVVYSRKKFVYAAIAFGVVSSMLITPIWQGVKASELASEMQAKNESIRAQQEENKDERQAIQDYYAVDWNPNQSPYEQSETTEVVNSLDSYNRLSNQAYSTTYSHALDQGASEGNATDSDQDGLTDEFEDQFCPNYMGECILDSSDPDTDDDGLTDGEEARIGTLTSQADSDGDGIHDKDEVESFYFAGKYWFSDPMSRDTDKDGNLDGIECPQRVMPDSAPPGWTPGPCTQDTDLDGIPDIFDTDDDQDGVSSFVDTSDYGYSTQVYSVTHPLNVTVSGLMNSVETIFMNYQLRPKVEEHLTYAMNVLDWPTGDVDGQIQRVSDTTFATHLTAEEREKDPKAANGDMRLMPMIEVRLAGSTLPLPLTTTLMVPITDTIRVANSISGTFKLTGYPNGTTDITLAEGPPGSYVVRHGTGDCDQDYKLDRLLGTLALGTTVTDASNSLGAYADGGHILWVTTENENVVACVNVLAAAHGNLVNQVVNQTLMRNYGAQARQDVDGSVNIYASLSLVYDYVGGTPLAFQARIPFTNVNDGFSDSRQEVRVVWLLNMLTDSCSLPEGQKFEDYCKAEEISHWKTDISRVVHTYVEQFTLVGLSVQEDHGVDMAVVFEDPAIDPDPQYDDPLWGLSHGLNGSFLAARDSDGVPGRDITVATIEQRFDPNLNNCSGDVDPDSPYIYREGYSQDWGLPCNAFQVWRQQYSFADEIINFMSDQVTTEIFDPYFNSLPAEKTPEYANLLFVREESSRSVALGETGAVCNGSGCTFDFSGEAILTSAVMNWAPYKREGTAWDSFPLEDYLDVLEANLRELDAYRPEDESMDAKYTVDGKIYMSRIYYQSIYRGLVTPVEFNGTPVINAPQVIEDSYVYDEFYRTNKAAQIITLAVKGLANQLCLGFFQNLEFLVMYGVKVTFTERASAFYRALGEYLSNKISAINKFFGRFSTAFWVGAAILVVAAVVGIVLLLTAPDSPGKRVGMRILFAAAGLLAAALAIRGLYAIYAAGKVTTEIAKVSASAAKIGLVIGLIITWGVFIGMWASSGESFGSLAVNNLLADAIATTIALVLLAVLACNPVGLIITLIIALIDALIMLVCAAAGAYEQEPDHWSQQYVCIGITGWIIKIFKWFIYGMEFMIDYDNGGRLELSNLQQEIQDSWLGMASGNWISYTLGVTNTIELQDIPIDWKAAVYAWQWTDNSARSSHFKYAISAGDGEEYDIDGGLERFNTSAWDADQGSDRNHGWSDVPNSDKFVQEFIAHTNNFSIQMPEAGINRTPRAFFSEGAAVPVQECWVFPIPWPPSVFPICYVRTENNTSHSGIGTSLTVDVFPTTLDEFYALYTKEDSGVSFNWGLERDFTPDPNNPSGTTPSALVFPTFKDADGDGLLSLAQGGNDPDDSRFDTDGDGLSDYSELAEGMNPRMIDTDDDGLLDSEEVIAGTDAKRKDTDGDGLPDNEEIAGWLFTYSFEADGTPNETMVYPDSRLADTDFDGLTDLEEKIYGFNPNVNQDPSVLNYALSTREQDSPLVLLRFDEDSGSTMFADSSNFGFSASCQGDACPLSGLDGRYAKAIRLDGVDDHLNLTTSAQVISLWDGQPFTLGAWVNWNGASGTILSKWSDQSGYKQEIRFEVDSNGYLKLINSSSTAISSGSAINSGTWRHVAAAFDGSQVSFYIDGISDSGGGAWSTPVTAAISDTQIMVGAYMGSSGASGFFGGDLDELAIFDRALTQAEIQDSSDQLPHMLSARYNLNDQFVRPGEKITYKSVVENLLNSRFAFGLLTTSFNPREAIVDWMTKLLPTTFKLWPDNPAVTDVNSVVISDTLQIDPGITTSSNLTIAQTVAAQIVDQRSESNFAEIWLQFEEASGAEFVDSSGNMPPRFAHCDEPCPTRISNGILNGAVQFESGNKPVNLYRKLSPTTSEALTLGEMDLVGRGYTIALWVKPPASASDDATLTLFKSANNNLFFSIKKNGSENYYLPVVWVNNEYVDLSGRYLRTVLPGVWSHVALRYNGANQTMDITINGVRVIPAVTVSPIVDAATNDAVWIGGDPQDGTYQVDDVRIFNRSLSNLDINRLAERPVLQLRMDTSKFADSSIYDQPITFTFGITPSLSTTGIRNSSMVPGKGSTLSYLKANGNALLDMQDGAFTFSTWIFPQSGGTSTDWQGIFGLRDDTTYYYPTLERLGKQLRFGFQGATPKTSDNVLTGNAWNHVVVTFEPREVSGEIKYMYELFVNAVPRDSYLFSTKPDSSAVFFVGHSSKDYTTIAKNFYVLGHDDPGHHAEVYINKWANSNKSRVWGVSDVESGEYFNCQYPPGSCNFIDRYTYTNYETVKYEVWEEDDSSADDHCGDFTFHWYDLPEDNYDFMRNGFIGSFFWRLEKPSTQFFGKIDELEVYRYGLDTEQVFDLYNAIPISGRLPLDDRPGANSFENRAYVGIQDNGVCTDPGCPFAGTVGLIDQAVRFDGANDVITVPADPSVNPTVNTTSSYMVSLWLNTVCPSCGIYTLRSGTTVRNEIYLRNGNVCAKTEASELCTSGNGFADEQWHHVVYSNAESIANLWLDGQKVNTITGGAAISPGDNVLLGQADGADQDYFYGQLDDVRVFRAIQPDSVIAMLRQRAPLALFHLDEPKDTTVFEDATTADWTLSCSGEGCPQADMEGRLGSSVEFDGNDTLSLTQSQLSAATGSFSAGIWVMPGRVVSNPQTLLTIGNATNSAPRYSIATASNTLKLCVLNTGNNSLCAAQSKVGLVQDVWNFVTLTVEQPVNPTSSFTETVKLYINGYLDSTLAGNFGTASELSGLGMLTIGDKPAIYSSMAGGPFGGRIDETTVYEYLLNEIDVRDTFYYQMAQVEEQKRVNLTIDADNPQAKLVSYNPDFPYLKGSDTQLHVEATDPTSGISMLEMQVERGGSPFAYKAAPQCMDAEGTSYCPTFIPGNNNGAFTLRFQAVDLVGRRSTSPDYTIYVDPIAPTVFSNVANNALVTASPHPSQPKTWVLKLSGSVFDPTQDDGTPGSGVNLDTVRVTLYDKEGNVVGAGAQAPQLSLGGLGYDWDINYMFYEREPTGKLKVVVEAADKIGNLGRREFNIKLDTTPSRAKLNSDNLSRPDLTNLLSASTAVTPTILISGTLNGEVSDVPGDDLPYIDPEGKDAAFGVQKVELAFTPELDYSYLFNEPYPKGLLAWLPLDGEKYPVDEDGNPDPQADTRLFLDISPYQIAGECPVANCPQAGVPGHKMGTVYYDGLGQYINLGQQVDLAGRSFTASIWAKRDKIDHNDPMLWQGPVSIPGLRFLFGLNSQNHFVCGFGGTDLVSPEAYPDIDWHYWACTYNLDSGKRSIYRDGKQIASDTSAPIPDMYENLYIGQAPVGNYQGYLDELVIYKRTLSSEEIRKEYTGYNTVFHLAVEESFYAAGDLVPDSSGYFHTAELQTGDGDALNKVVAGKVGLFGLSFDGNDRLAVLPAYSLNPDRAAFTQSAWIYPTGTGERDVISERDENPEMRYPSIILTTANGLRVGFGNFYDWQSVETGPNVVAQDEWSFVAATFDGQTYRIFVNGELVLASTELAGLIPYGAERFNIGENYLGEIDDVRIFMRVLSELEIQALMGMDWRMTTLDGSGVETTWSGELVYGLEGPYHIGLRGWDDQNHYDTGPLTDDQWSTLVDTLAPRISMQREPDPVPPNTFTVTYTFSVEDTMLDEESILENMCAGEVQLKREYYNSSWYLASSGMAPNTAVYRVSGQCQGDRRTIREVGLYACDTGGNCSSATFPEYYANAVYLPLVFMVGGSRQPSISGVEPSAVSLKPVKPPEGAQKLIERPLASPEDTQAPWLEITTRHIDQKEVRSLIHINLQGRVTDDTSVEQVMVRVLLENEEIYITQAAVYEDLWNALWVFTPGSIPADGAYILEVMATDLAGNQSKLSQEIRIQLLSLEEKGR